MRHITRTWILTIFLTTLITTQISAQNPKVDFFTEIPQGKSLLKDQQRLKLGKLEKNKHIKSISIVNVKKLIDHQKEGFLPFKLPGIQDVLVAKANSVEIKSEDEFTWSGLFEDRSGQVILISEKGGLYGHISIDDHVFELHYLGDGSHALVELDLKQFTSEECGTPDKPIENDDKEKDNGDKSGRWTNCALPVRVLVLFTANAQAAVTNINQTATLAITQTNTAFTNSAIFSNSVQVTMAGPIQLNFTETANIQTDVQSLSIDANAQALRNANGADIVILLTNGVDYGGVIGIVRDIGPNNAFSYAIVQATGATGTFSFAHELGHLFGGRHQQCNIFLNGGCDDTAGFAHGFAFGSNSITMMHQLRNGSNRVLNYSNPNVAVSSNATGIAASNHNSRQITEQVPTVSAFRPFVGQLTASAIVRKSYPSAGTERYRIEAVATCGQSPISYEWRISSDGFGYGGVMSISEFYTIDIAECSYFYVWLRIYSADGQAANHYFTIGTPPGGPCQIARKAAISSLFESEKQDETIRIYPNPAQTEINAQFFLSTSESVTVELVDVRGTKLVNSTYPLEIGWHNKKINTESLSGGIYILKVQKKSGSVTRKIIVAK